MRNWFDRSRRGEERRWQPSRDFRNADARNYDDWRKDGTPWDEHPRDLYDDRPPYSEGELNFRHPDFNNHDLHSYSDYMEAAWRRRQGLDPWADQQPRERVDFFPRRERGHWDY